MSIVNGILIDEGLTDILTKLRNTEINKSSKQAEAKTEKPADTDKGKSLASRFAMSTDNTNTTLVNTYKQLLNDTNSNGVTVNDLNNYVQDSDLVDEDILPWFSPNDADTQYFHYMDLSGEHKYVKASTPVKDITTLQLNKTFLCSLRYFKSKHNVLGVRQLPSDYSYSRSFIASNESVKNNIVLEDVTLIESDNNPNLTKVATENITQKVVDSYTYYHFVVYTDLGIADFVAKSDDVSYPYNEKDLNDWFEKVSNLVVVKNPHFESNKDIQLADSLDNVLDYDYNLISVVRPGLIVLDSSDNTNDNYKVFLKIKDEYSFIPAIQFLRCLKTYSVDKKSNDDLKLFINRYFDVLV